MELQTCRRRSGVLIGPSPGCSFGLHQSPGTSHICIDSAVQVEVTSFSVQVLRVAKSSVLFDLRTRLGSLD